MRMLSRIRLVAAAAALGCAAAFAAEVPADLAAVVAGPQRAPENVARDKYRHPGETLAFFGLRPEMTVVELVPGGGWFTEILAPYLRDKGKLIAAAYPLEVPGEDSEYYRRSRSMLDAKFAAAPTVYDKVVTVDFLVPTKLELAPAGSVDMVVTFRNFHNWVDDQQGEDLVMAAAFKALKPGGVLGIEEHRTPNAVSRKDIYNKGYAPEATVIAAAEKAGFKLEEKSEINANAKDTHDHPEGVWTLPPSLALKDVDKAKYLAIGESDRMTLRFRKPK
jgi:predicted methyltransferase